MGSQDVTKDPPPDSQDGVAFSNGIRLTGREWIVVGVFAVLLAVFAPSLWKQAEPIALGLDYRMPHDLSNDYWLFTRYADLGRGECGHGPSGRFRRLG